MLTLVTNFLFNKLFKWSPKRDVSCWDCNANSGNQLRGRQRTRWSDYISDLAWSHLGAEPAEMSEI